MNAIYNFLKLIPDKIYIQLKYFKHFGKFVDFKNPKTFNEKIQWLKLYDFKDDYIKMVDKIAAKKYVKNIIGEDYIIPNIGIWDNPFEINFNELPNEFVLKWNHDSGSAIICKDKRKFDIEKATRKLEKYRNHNGYLYGRERPYKYVKPKILAEKYMEDKKTEELRDYKFFCMNGKVKFFKIDYNRYTKHQAKYFDTDGNLLNFSEKALIPDKDKKIDLPVNLNKMISLAEELSQNIIFVRIDFYEVDGKIYFSEITFYPASGFGKISPMNWDYKLGDLINLPITNDPD